MHNLPVTLCHICGHRKESHFSCEIGSFCKECPTDNFVWEHPWRESAQSDLCPTCKGSKNVPLCSHAFHAPSGVQQTIDAPAGAAPVVEPLIASDPETMGGTPRIAGHRIGVCHIIGAARNAIVAATKETYPQLSESESMAAIDYAVEVSAKPAHAQAGELLGIVLSFHDIPDARQDEIREALQKYLEHNQ